MSHADPIAPLYDHERDDAPAGRRRGATHDWGADDLFDGSRQSRRGHRFERASGRFERDDAPRTGRRASAPWSDLTPPAADDVRPRPAPPHAATDDLDRPRERAVADWFADDERKRVDDWLAAGRSAAVDHADPAADHDEADLPSSTAPTLELDLPLGETRPARRTVTVTGHPDAVRRAERAGEIARRRPAPSLDARIAHRPDRVAMYACALGLLLVLVAILTAHT